MASIRTLVTNAAKSLRTGRIIENILENLFVITINNSDIAEVRYDKKGDVYDLTNTLIPDQYRGQGLGSILAERVFDHLVERKKRFKLTCEFLQDFYSKNEDKYKNFVVQ